eukprot:4500380-Prymnesium_polylepis.1
MAPLLVGAALVVAADQCTCVLSCLTPHNTCLPVDAPRSYFDEINKRDELQQAVKAQVAECLTPQRSGEEPQLAVFLIGDSHANSLSQGLMASLDGAASVAWAAMGAGCGWVGSRVRRAEYQCEEEDCHDNHGAQACKGYVEGVRSTLSTQLQPCDVVVVHMSRGKWGGTENDPWDDFDDTYAEQVALHVELQALVRSKGAKLVLVGDSIDLPEEPSYCIPSAVAPNAGERCEQTIADIDAFNDHV